MANQTKTSTLWTPRSVDDTKQIYTDWADTYDDDLAAMNYATPDRVAGALVAQSRTDITPEMLAHARNKTYEGTPLYRKTWLGDVGVIAATPGDYSIIVATGVVSLGAAPPAMLPNRRHSCVFVPRTWPTPERKSNRI